MMMAQLRAATAVVISTLSFTLNWVILSKALARDNASLEAEYRFALHMARP